MVGYGDERVSGGDGRTVGFDNIKGAQKEYRKGKNSISKRLKIQQKPANHKG